MKFFPALESLKWMKLNSAFEYKHEIFQYSKAKYQILTDIFFKPDPNTSNISEDAVTLDILAYPPIANSIFMAPARTQTLRDYDKNVSIQILRAAFDALQFEGRKQLVWLRFHCLCWSTYCQNFGLVDYYSDSHSYWEGVKSGGIRIHKICEALNFFVVSFLNLFQKNLRFNLSKHLLIKLL